MPPAYVKPYVKRGKTDAADAEAVCEAVTRPTMRFVPVKSPEQQGSAVDAPEPRSAGQAAHAADQHDPRSTGRVDIPKGLERALLMARQIVDGKSPEVPVEAAKIVGTLSQQALDTHVRLREIDRDLAVWLRGNEVARRLTTIPGIGPVGATALAASVTDPHQFRSGRQFAAWLELTPLQKSSGGKERLGRITKMGDKYLRKLLIVGMTSLVRRATYNPGKIDPRLADLLARKPVRVATVAMANKTARVIWAIMSVKLGSVFNSEWWNFSAPADLPTRCRWQRTQIAAVARPAPSAGQRGFLQSCVSVAASVPAFFDRLTEQMSPARAPLPRRRQRWPGPEHWPLSSLSQRERLSAGWCRKRRAPAICDRTGSSRWGSR